MSTFNGTIPEIPFASIDRFDGNNRQSSVFFLSHCHTDHMVGLSGMQMADTDRDECVKWPSLYLSSVSAVIVRGLFPQLQLNLVALNVGGNSRIIQYPSKCV